MNKVTICCLGHGGAFAAADVGNTAYLVQYRDHKILVDCGGTVPDVLKEFCVDPGSLTAVLVSHLHQDHVGGLERVLYHRHYINKSPPVPVFMGKDTRADWLTCMAACKNDLERHGVWLETTDPGRYGKAGIDGDISYKHLGGDVAVIALRVNHGGDVPTMSCYCFWLQLGDYRLFFSGDRIWRHKGDKEVFDLMRISDVVFHELELFPKPSGAHTNLADITDGSIDKIEHKIWWGHHGAALGREGLDHLRLARKGYVWQLDHEGTKLIHRD